MRYATQIASPHSSHPTPLDSSQVVLSSDEEVFGGYRNVTKDSDVTFTASGQSHDNRPNSFQVWGGTGVKP